MQRRTFLKVLGATTAGAIASRPLMQALADNPDNTREFFIVIHQAGGWDVTLWSDPRNERKGLVEPASTDNLVTAGLTNWVDQALDADSKTFQLVMRGGRAYGPAMGSLVDMFDRFQIINGISMNTVSHPDGTYYSSTGRHLAGGRPVASSIDTMLGNELGTNELLPIVSVNFPSTFIGQGLDRRAMPLRVADITAVAKSITRSTLWDQTADRDGVTALLTNEAASLAKDAWDPAVPNGMGLQYQALQKMLGDDVRSLFDANKLKTAHPGYNYAGAFQRNQVINAAFAVDAIKSGLVRCVSWAMSSCDTHNSNYRNHGLILQETFEMLSNLIKELDNTFFDDAPTVRLSDHVHVLVISEFCRTPQINLSQGRDHYPNNSSLIISPKFKGNFRYGSSDPDQLLPMPSGTFSDGVRPITPPDVLASFLGAFGIDPLKYLRDGQVVKELLK